MSLPTTNRGARFAGAAATAGDFSNIEVEDFPLSAVGDDDVLVRVTRAAVNPIDWKVQAGALTAAGWSLPSPFTLGYDIAGTVVSTGSSVSGFSSGERVFGVLWGQGSHDDDISPERVAPGGAVAEYVSVPARKLSKVPEGVTDSEAAAVSLVGTTAHEILFHFAKLVKGQRVLVLGGAGAVGSLAVQLAREKGVWVATTASTRNVERVSGLGPDKIVNYTEADWSEDEGLKGIDAVIDTVGEKDGFERAKKILKEDGAFVSIASFDAGFDPTAHAPLSFASFVCLNNSTAVQDELVSLLAAKKLKLEIEEEFPFTTEGVRAALTKQFGGKSNGKLVIKITE